MSQAKDIAAERYRSLEAGLVDLRDRPKATIELAERLSAAHVPAWRGYAAWDPSRMLSQAQHLAAQAIEGKPAGPCHGLPVSINDNIGLAGWPMKAGSDESLPGAWQRDAAITARFRRAGALFTGITHTVSIWSPPRLPA